MPNAQRTVLITGCSQGGLGDNLCQALKKQDWRVFPSARNLAKVQHLKDADFEVIQLDVLSEESIKSAAAKVAELTGGTLDLLLNNAGAVYAMPILDMDIAKAKNQFDLNFFSILNVSRTFLPLIIKSAHGGIIANNTSVASQTLGGLPFQSAYNCSKAAATMLTENMRVEFEPLGVRVVNLLTGGIKTNIFEHISDTALPANSVYNVAKERVEKAMNGAHVMANATPAPAWATQVASELSRSNPSYWIWRGKDAAIVRTGMHLPTGTFDRITKGMTGIDEVDRKIKEQGGPSSLKIG